MPLSTANPFLMLNISRKYVSLSLDECNMINNLIELNYA